MKHAASLKLHAYWLSCRGAMGVPASGIRADELTPLMPSLFLFDLDQQAGTRVRFCGSEIARRFGRDISDENFLALWRSDDRALLAGHLRTLAAHSLGLVAGVIGETLGGGVTSFEMLILPLEGQASAAGAIGSMVRIGGHEETNRIRARLITQSLRSMRFLPTPARSLSPDASRAMARIAAAPNAFRSRYSHLSIVPGGRTHPTGLDGP